MNWTMDQRKRMTVLPRTRPKAMARPLLQAGTPCNLRISVFPSHPRRIESTYEEQLKTHREKIGELVLQIDILKKATELLSEDENSSLE